MRETLLAAFDQVFVTGGHNAAVFAVSAKGVLMASNWAATPGSSHCPRKPAVVEE
jgi:ABC-type phosphate/phosphonate transport system substrate-binding protein